MASPEPLHEGLILFDRYLLEAPLSKPRTGHSWRAKDRRLDMTVVLKVFDQHPLPSTLEQGIREHLDVTHPNLARTFEFMGDSTRCAVVTEFVEGRSLGTLLRDRLNGCFEIPEIRRWTGQLLACLSAVHKKGKVHGDLNLENLLVNERNDLKVLDLGLLEGRMKSRHADLAFSSPACMSPESLHGDRAQPGDDLYAVGACIFELLTGRPVFAGGNVPMQVEVKAAPLLNDRRAELANNLDPVDEEWEAWVNACLSKERRHRPASADALLEIVRRSAGTTTRGPTAPLPMVVETSLPPAHATAPITYVSTPQGMAIPMMMAPPHPQSSPWGKIITAGVAAVSLGIFYFGSWKPSRAEMKQMEMDFQKLRQVQNKVSDELGSLRELESVLEDFVSKYSGVDILYSERDDILRTQAEERLDACVVKIKELERTLAIELQKERDDKQVALKASFDKATETTQAAVSARTKLLKWQVLLDYFGDWDNPDSVQDNKMIAEARKAVEQFKAEQQKETEQMLVYGQNLQLAIEHATKIRANPKLTAGLKWKAFSEAPKLPAKAPGEQAQDFTKLEESYDQLRKELDDAARKETPEEPQTLESLFANSSFGKLAPNAKADLISGAQRVLKGQGLLLMDQPDGQPGKATHQSIANFQLSRGLLANGELTDETLWQLGYEGGPLASTVKESVVKETTSKSTKRRIPACPPESIYEGVGGKIRLGKDKLFKRLNEAEYKKHLRYQTWQEKYGDL